MKKAKFTFIDLFSGIGGFRMALEKHGGECLRFSEINSDAINTYCANFNEPPNKNLGDITKIKSLPRHNLLTAGVPCQSWSIAGRNLGFDDDRGQLWNDTIFLLNQSKPDAFIFENVKGLVDPRNQKALSFILSRIREAGYHANYHVLNSFDYGVPQNRVRIYIIGFRDKEFAMKFKVPQPIDRKVRLADVLCDFNEDLAPLRNESQETIHGEIIGQRRMSLSASSGLNDYFLFNDLRNGHSTVHSWDIMETSERQKRICLLLLRNRRKRAYGPLDGNPLSLNHLIALDKSITQTDINNLVEIGILKMEEYAFQVNDSIQHELSEDERAVFECNEGGRLVIDKLKTNRQLKIKKISISTVINSLVEKGIIECCEVRYDFKNTKISTGLYGVNRIFLPTSHIFPTLVASDTNDFVTNKVITAKTEKEYKKQFVEQIYKKGNYRKVTKEEACLIQGFPVDYILPESRVRWMKLIGNSVSVPVIEMLCGAILETGIFDNTDVKNHIDSKTPVSERQISMMHIETRFRVQESVN